MKTTIQVLTGCILLAASTVNAAVKPKVSTPEEKAARAERRLNALNETGGFIADPRNAQGKYVFIDMDCGIEESVINAAAAKCQNSCMILVEVSKEKKVPFSFAVAEESFRKSGGIMSTFLIDEADWPMEIVCPGRRWAVVNVRQLKNNAPSQEVFEARVRKMMSRSIGLVFQAGYAFSSVSTMNLVSTPSDLDRIATEGLATECTTVIQATAEKFGYTTMKRVLYSKACMEGWAPPPINDFQKSAWDKVHQLPSKPITIDFDLKRGK